MRHLSKMVGAVVVTILLGGCLLAAQLPGGDYKAMPNAKESAGTIKTEKDDIEVDTSTVKFFDSMGKLRQRIPLNTLTTREKVKTGGEDLEIEITYSKIPVVSKNKKYVLINAKTSKAPVDRKRLGECECPEANEIALYGTEGTLIYKKQFPGDTGFSDTKQQIAVSDAGVAALILENNVMKGDYWTKLYVYDRRGDLILNYPDDNTIINAIYPSNMNISQNGRYLALQVRFPYPEPTVTVFFDLKKKAWWKSGFDYWLGSISDTGKAKASYRNPKVPDNAAVKSVKEPLYINENLDLMKHFGE